jgi:serralysin
VLWNDKTITYYMDGAAFHTTATPADMNQPMYMIANMAVGGSWAGLPDGGFAGADYKIDYVRAYSLTPSSTSASAPSASTPAGSCPWSTPGSGSRPGGSTTTPSDLTRRWAT